MMRRLKNRRAQSVASEYVLVFFIVVSVMSVMTVYFKRAVQGRIAFFSSLMVSEVIRPEKGKVQDSLGFTPRERGILRYYYAPYYTNSQAEVSTRSWSRDKLEAGGTTGLFSREIDFSRNISSTSNTLPPRDADFMNIGEKW